MPFTWLVAAIITTGGAIILVNMLSNMWAAVQVLTSGALAPVATDVQPVAHMTLERTSIVLTGLFKRFRQWATWVSRALILLLHCTCKPKQLTLMLTLTWTDAVTLLAQCSNGIIKTLMLGRPNQPATSASWRVSSRMAISPKQTLQATTSLRATGLAKVFTKSIAIRALRH